MKLISLLTLAGLLSLGACSHMYGAKSCCAKKEKCTTEACKKSCCDKDKVCKDGSCTKQEKKCTDDSCHKKA